MVNEDLMVAFEAGYVACEKGQNIQLAKSMFKKVLTIDIAFCINCNCMTKQQRWGFVENVGNEKYTEVV